MSGPPHGRWFEDLADHLGEAYLRYSFTKGTAPEVEFLTDALRLSPGDRLLDAGCGPGRHAAAFTAAGVDVVGVDVSHRFAALAAADVPGAAFVRADVRRLPFPTGAFDAVVSLCQGGFGLLGGAGDEEALAALATALRPGGGLAVTAFSAYFQVRWLEDHDHFDAGTGVNHEHTTVKDPAGRDAPAELWTTCFTPRELRLMAEAAGLEVEGVWSVEPGRYRRQPPTVDSPEFLLLGRRRA